MRHPPVHCVVNRGQLRISPTPGSEEAVPTVPHWSAVRGGVQTEGLNKTQRILPQMPIMKLKLVTAGMEKIPTSIIKKDQSTDANPENTQGLGLSDKDFKAAIRKISQQSIEILLKQMKKVEDFRKQSINKNIEGIKNN